MFFTKQELKEMKARVDKRLTKINGKCECGGNYQDNYDDMLRHNFTRKHLDFEYSRSGMHMKGDPHTFVHYGSKLPVM